MLFYLFIVMIACLGVGISLRYLWQMIKEEGDFFSFHYLLLLCGIYGTVLIGFGCMYLSFEMLGVKVVHENGHVSAYLPIHILELCLYFSAVTLFSVGYGDVIPVGFGRWIAVIEALIGYTMPAAFFVHSIMHPKQK